MIALRRGRKTRFLAVVGLSISLLVSMSASSCKSKPKVCEPSSVRQDSYQADRWWLCNEDGTEEKVVKEPPWDPPGVKI